MGDEGSDTTICMVCCCASGFGPGTAVPPLVVNIRVDEAEMGVQICYQNFWIQFPFSVE